MEDLESQIALRSESTGKLAAGFIDQDARSHGLLEGSALIAATSPEHGLTLCTSDARPFRLIRGHKVK